MLTLSIVFGVIVLVLLFNIFNRAEDFTIDKGWHYSRWIFLRIPCLSFKKIIGGEFMLSPSCYFNQRNHDDFDLNKLTGVTRGLFVHRDSVRLAWRPDFDHADTFQVYAYVYQNGERATKYITTVKAYEKVPFEINLAYKSGYRFTVAEKSDYIPGEGKRWGFILHPYFGGNNKAPHRMKVYVKQIKCFSPGLVISVIMAAMLFAGCNTTKHLKTDITQVNTEKTTTGKVVTESKTVEQQDTIIIIPGEKVTGESTMPKPRDSIVLDGSGIVISVTVQEDKVKITGEKKPQKVSVKVEKVTEVKKTEETQVKDIDKTVTKTTEKDVKRNYLPFALWGLGALVVIAGIFILFKKLKIW